MLLDLARWRRLLPLLGVLALLAGYNIGQPPLHAPEKTFIEVASSSTFELFRNGDHPLYLTALRCWSAVSHDRTWLRLANLLTAIMVLVAAERTLPLLGGNHAARGALILLALAPLLVREIRQLGPSVIGLLSILLCLLCFLEYLRAGAMVWLTGWFASILVGTLADAHLSYQVILYNVMMVLYRKRTNNKQRRWWLLQTPVLVVSILYAVPRLSQPNTLHAQTAAIDVLSVASDLFVRVITGQPLDQPIVHFGALFFAFLTVCGLWGCRNIGRDLRHGLLLFSSLTPVLFASLFPPAHSLLLAALPGTVTMIAIGLRQLPRWLRQICWTILTCIHILLYRAFFLLADLKF